MLAFAVFLVLYVPFVYGVLALEPIPVQAGGALPRSPGGVLAMGRILTVRDARREKAEADEALFRRHPAPVNTLRQACEQAAAIDPAIGVLMRPSGPVFYVFIGQRYVEGDLAQVAAALNGE